MHRASCGDALPPSIRWRAADGWPPARCLLRVLDGKSIQQRLSGTPAFSAPEVINCSCEDAFAADVWALGACLYCFMFGRLPFQVSLPPRLCSCVQLAPAAVFFSLDPGMA
jgi:serine/threonine protein kinase